MEASSSGPVLDPFQIACLAGGTRALCETAIVSLTERRLLRLDRTSGRLFAQGELPAGAHPVERAVHAAATRPHAPMLFEAMFNWTVRTLHERERAGTLNEHQLRRVRSLEERGPMFQSQPGASFDHLRLAARQPAREVQGELVRLGLLRPRRLLRDATRTSAGARLLEDLRSHHSALRQTDRARAQPVLAVAIWGLGALIGTPLSEIDSISRPTE